MRLKVISWNIRQGGGTRAEEIAKALISHKADIIILSEFQNNAASHLIRIRLLLDGYLFQSPSTDDKEINGVLIASRHISSFHPNYTAVDFPEAVLICRLEAVSIVGVYLPHKKKHTRFKQLIDLATDQSTKLIIAGDFNSGFNKIDQTGDSFWYEDKLRDLLNVGMVDAYRAIHQSKMEYSWYSHQGNGFRYDHTWISVNLSNHIIDCNYSHLERTTGLSDHSLMILELDI